MAFEWKTALLGELCTMKNGYAFKSGDFTDHGVAVIKIKNVKPNRIIMDDLSFVPQAIADQRKKWLIEQGEILLTMTGNRADGSPESWVGKAAIFNENEPCLLNQRVSAIKTKDSAEIDTAFLGYYLSSWETQLYFIKRANSSGGQANISPDIVMNMPVSYPELVAQKKIVSILSAIDAKIRVNNTINDNLQEQALSIFRKMFIETSNDSRHNCRADDYFDISIGKTPPRKEPQWFSMDPADRVWVSISDMGSCGVFIADSSEYLTHESVEKFNVKVVPDNTVLLSFKLTVGRVAITDGAMATNEAIAHFKTENDLITEYLYCYLKGFNYQTMGSTSSIATAVNSKIIKAMPFTIPTNEELTEFHAIVAPMFAMIKGNQRENSRLAGIRDSLLPRLMSGEIDVSTIEI